MSKLNICFDPNPILHKKCAKIKKFDKKLNKLVLDMVETMRAGNGAGLAAPQIGKLIRLICLEYDPAKTEEEYRNKLRAHESIPLNFLINPKITMFSRATHIAEEGCLSLPEKWVPVERSVKINVLAQDIKGNRIKIRAHDYHARLLQHEIDHLDGILMTDKFNKNKNEEI